MIATYRCSSGRCCCRRLSEFDGVEDFDKIVGSADYHVSDQSVQLCASWPWHWPTAPRRRTHGQPHSFTTASPQPLRTSCALLFYCIHPRHTVCYLLGYFSEDTSPDPESIFCATSVCLRRCHTSQGCVVGAQDSIQCTHPRASLVERSVYCKFNCFMNEFRYLPSNSGLDQQLYHVGYDYG